MKFVTVADLRNKFSKVSNWIDHGESVTITKRGRPFASLHPLGTSSNHPKTWPDRKQWRDKVYKQNPAVGDSEKVLDYDRGDT